VNSIHFSFQFFFAMSARTSQLAALFSFVYADAADIMRGDDFGPLLKPSKDMTNDGCTCRTPCGAAAHEDYGRCDWCYTEDNCGQKGHSHWLHGYWDYCKYSPMEEFEAQNYRDKQSQLWARTTDPSVVGQSAPSHLAAHTLTSLLGLSMITPFDDQWEVLPAGRERIIHTQGVVCQIDFQVNSNSPFTGVLSPGTQHGMIRFGSAASLDEPVLPKIFPGFGIKFLRSGVRSADWVSLRTVGDGGSWNFMETEFANHVDPQPALVKLNKFQQASGCIDMVGLSDVCTYDQNGHKASHPVFPFEVVFEPTGKVRFSDQKKSNNDMLRELSSIRRGTDVLEAFAYESPHDRARGNKISLGTVTTSSECVQSLFGDLELFFRHQRMEEDFALRPDWISQMDELGDTGCDATTGPVSQWQCPVTGAGVAV